MKTTTDSDGGKVYSFTMNEVNAYSIEKQRKNDRMVLLKFYGKTKIYLAVFVVGFCAGLATGITFIN